MNMHTTTVHQTCFCELGSIVKFYNIPHTMALPDHVPLLRHTLSVVVDVFSAYSLLSSQTKQAVEPAVVPV